MTHGILLWQKIQQGNLHHNLYKEGVLRMTKKEFMDKLKEDLSSLSDKERAEALKYYEEYFGDMGDTIEVDNEPPAIPEDTKYCESCGTLNEAEHTFCSKCGESLDNVSNHTCWNCKTEIQNDAKFCLNCGKAINSMQPMRICWYCKRKTPINSPFCASCGKSINRNQVYNGSMRSNRSYDNGIHSNRNTYVTNTFRIPQGQRNKWVALLLCFFGGVFGLHKFYEGKIGLGILYLFTWGLFFIGAAIDFIAILLKPEVYYK